MYLKELYKQSKGWFIVATLFIIVQLVNNIRQDVSLSPVYQYGMYSKYISPKEPQGVFEINVNGKILQPENFSIRQWDKIILPLRYFAASKCNNNTFYEHDVKRLFQKIYIIADSSQFIYPFDTSAFFKNYQPYLSYVTNEKIKSLHINYSIYQLDSSFHKTQTGPLREICE